MKTMDDVFHAVHQWNELRSNEAAMLELLNQGDCFSFHRADKKSDHLTDATLHAYPAVWEEHLYFISIPAELDTHAVYETGKMFDSLDVCGVFHYSFENLLGPKQSSIPNSEASERIRLWNDTHNEWIPLKVTFSLFGIYQAFVIPKTDIFQGNIHLARFALNPETELELPIADLIIENLESNDSTTRVIRTFDDLVTPVPPFSPSNVQSEIDPSEPTKGFFILTKALE